MSKLSDFISFIDRQNIQSIMTVIGTMNLNNVIPINRDWYFIMLENDVSGLREKLKCDMSLTLNSPNIRETIQTSITRGNEYAEQEKKMNCAIHEINVLLNANNPLDTFKALNNENAMLPQGLKEFAATLYHYELQLAKQDKQDDLTHEELSAAVEVLQCVAAVNSAIESSLSDALYKALTLTDSYFENLQNVNANHYLEELKKSKETKIHSKNPLLTHSEIQTVVDCCNKRAAQECARILCLEKINKCLKHGSHKSLMPILMEPCLELTRLSNDSSEVYFYSLQIERNKKRKTHNTDDLWFDDIRNAVVAATEILMQATRLGLKLTAINLALDKQDAVEVYHYLTNKDLNISNVIRDCKEIYLQRMLEVRRFKISEIDSRVGSGWIQCRLTDKPISFYYNVKDRCILWSKPEDNSSNIFVKDSSLLNREELQAIIDMVNTEFKRELLFLSNEDFIIRLQSRIRGYLVRERLESRWRYFKFNIEKIIKIQSFWRMVRCKRRHIAKLRHYKSNISNIIIVQSFGRMTILRRQYLARKKYFVQHMVTIIKIQSLWRAVKIRKDYKALQLDPNPSIKVIKRFIHLLENSYNDYQEEIEIQALKQQISNAIRQNRLLEEQIKEMDIKIGLLVRNRISLEEVLSHHVNMKNFRSNIRINNGLIDSNNDVFLQNMINRTTRQKIESYQHLFYALQTNPHYLANLVIEMPHMQQTKFVETVIFSLYNYGSSNRDEYLLLGLFKRAVESEINTKIQNHPNDFLSANPFVVKLIVGLCRTAHAQASLKTILQPLIKSVIDDEEMKINTSPTEVYKAWVNELEVNSGSPCGLPYDITSQAAIKHPEVRNIIEKSVIQLKLTCQRFMRALLKTPDRLPYSMRFMARVIKECLHNKFPEHPEKDILKVVGNLIYYRYINSAIVAPDAFDMLERNVSNILPPEKRRNLASIAKLLQFATSNKGFGFESPHLAEVLNPFIRQCHEKFKEYFREVCRVENPELHFNMDQYSDLISFTKPVIRMTIKEIRDTHNLLIQYQEAIAPDPQDMLHELLEDLGEPPLNDHLKDSTNQNTLIWLTLSPKHENYLINNYDYTNGAGGDRITNYNSNKSAENKDVKTMTQSHTFNDLALDTLFIHTKRIIVDLLTCMDLREKVDECPSSSTVKSKGITKQKCDKNVQKKKIVPAPLQVYLDSSTCIKSEEDSKHMVLLQSRQQLDRSLTPVRKKVVHSRCYLMELNLSLEEKRKHIRTNLSRLESVEIVNAKNDYQDILNAICRDIRTLKNYRCHRKAEINRLRDIYQQLGLKRQFHEDQMDYYEKYCHSCLENMTKKGKHQRSRSQNNALGTITINQNQLIATQPSLGHANKIESDRASFKTVKFSAHELKKKGVILEIDGLNNSQYKNLQFEICINPDQPANAGQFLITAKFMGVQMDKVCLLFSDLLQMQYEGTTTMRMFDRAKVNVNLLVFMLNKKFFAK